MRSIEYSPTRATAKQAGTSYTFEKVGARWQHNGTNVGNTLQDALWALDIAIAVDNRRAADCDKEAEIITRRPGVR